MVTMTQIARAAGVSQALVSRVLCGGGTNIRVGGQTADRIRATAHKLGYFANTAARAMRIGMFDSICLLQSTNPVKSILPCNLIRGIQEALIEKGKHLILSELPDEKLVSAGFVPKILTELFADGLLVNYNTDIPEAMMRLIDKHRIPSVWINSKQSHNCIYPDDFSGGVEATRHLIGLGHRNIGYAMYVGGMHYSSQERKEGYESAMKDAGLSPRVFQRDVDLQYVGGISHEILSSAERPTGIVCYTEKEVHGLVHAAMALGLRIPQDLSLVVFNPVPLVMVGMVVSTVLLPEREIGRKSVDLLYERILEPSAILEPVKVRCGFQAADSSAGPGQDKEIKT